MVQNEYNFEVSGWAIISGTASEMNAKLTGTESMFSNFHFANAIDMMSNLSSDFQLLSCLTFNQTYSLISLFVIIPIVRVIQIVISSSAYLGGINSGYLPYRIELGKSFAACVPGIQILEISNSWGLIRITIWTTLIFVARPSRYSLARITNFQFKHNHNLTFFSLDPTRKRDTFQLSTWQKGCDCLFDTLGRFLRKTKKILDVTHKISFGKLINKLMEFVFLCYMLSIFA